MGFVQVKLFVALQLSLLLVASLTVSAGHQVDEVVDEIKVAANVHSPAPAPKPYSHPPRHSPKPRPHPRPAPKGQVPTPAPAPKAHVPPPVPPPKVSPPSPAPRLPYVPPRTLVAVQGVVYCKSCKYPGVDTLLGATPIAGATVKLQCNNTKSPVTQQATTDKNGYFLLQAPKKVTTYGVRKCKVFLVSSPLASCQQPTNLHQGSTGAVLRYEKPKTPISFALYTVGPLAFAPKCVK
ncbi:PREDICTED: non-classical arabinogalactan protein 31-like [Nelumbo nucifera]|uniref:Non-classical arabinogalactan protein 31-like n=1 Tax=Nelumbo nucifera TaxID=4432 RepID=A0A1U8A1Z2_NELNU|nr:PREDICTED: non-classical arabinogalactan protein 31-like [Nelumbo nucifera]